MKKHIKYLIPIFLTAFLFSCEIENDPFENTQEKKLDLEVENASLNPISSKTLSKDAISFERAMQWASFIAADVIANNQSAKDEISYLLGSGNTVSLEYLLSGNIDASNFEADFRHILFLYVYPNYPERPAQTPPDPPIDPDGNGILPYTQAELVDLFISYMIEDNCVELYFPVGLTHSIGVSSYTSTAHTLTNVIYNNGVKRKYNPVPSVYNITAFALVNQFYVNSNPNIIVARPVRDLFSIECDYDEYNVDDFTDFLSSTSGGLGL